MSLRVTLFVLAGLLVVEIILLGVLPEAESIRPTERPTMIVKDMMDIEAHPTRAIDPLDARAGSVHFRLPEDWALQGVGVAVLYPKEDGRPSYHQALEVTLLQDPFARLRLSRWVREKPASGPYYLRFALRATQRESEAFFVGWAELEATDLLTGDIEVLVEKRSLLSAQVRLASGQPVPGAQVFLCGIFPLVDVTSLALRSDERGQIRAYGLRAGESISLVLPEGVGPYRNRIDVKNTVSEQVVDIIVPMSGRWQFDKVPIARGLPGQTVRIASLDSQSTAWAVSTLLIAGAIPPDPLYLMRRPDGDTQRRVRIHIAECEPIVAPLQDFLSGRSRLACLEPASPRASTATPRPAPIQSVR